MQEQRWMSQSTLSQKDPNREREGKFGYRNRKKKPKGKMREIRVESISSTFYGRIFHTKVSSKPNSKEIKAAQFTFVQKSLA